MKNRIFVLVSILILIGGIATTASSSWPVTNSNSWIRDPITTHDFVPLGVVIEQNPDGSLSLPSDGWRSNNFIAFGMGTTLDGNHSIIFHNGLSTDGGRYRISVDNGPWIEQGIGPPIYYDPNGTEFGTGFPTVYRANANKTQFMYISYDESTRTWYHKLQRDLFVLEAVGKARSIPFWMGKPEGPYIAHGVYSEVNDLDIWGGGGDMADLTVTSDISGQTLTYYGIFGMDREYHRSYEGTEIFGLPLSFTAMTLHVPGKIDMVLIQAVNPFDDSPSYKGVSLEHQARINFLDIEEDYTFDNFQYSDDGKFNPRTYYLRGDFEGGSVNLTAEAFQDYGWTPSKGTWWYSGVHHVWGRTFVRWNGEIILHGKTITIVNAFGFAEFTRVASLANADIPVSGSVMGSFVDTHISNDVYESIKESATTAGKPSERTSYLEHKWTIDVALGTKTQVTFYVEAYHTANSENDHFVFAYSKDDSSYTDMVTITKTADDAYQTYELPKELSGTVYIRVKDTDRTGGNTIKDAIYIDQMFIRSIIPRYGVTVTTDKASQVVKPGESTTYNVRVKNTGGLDASYSVEMSGTAVDETTITVSPLNWTTGTLTPGAEHVTIVTVSTASYTSETTYTLTATATCYQNTSVTDSTTSNLIVSSVIYTMHVYSIDMSLSKRISGKNTFTHATALVTIVDAANNPVEGATVKGHWSDATKDIDFGVTNAAGQVSLDSDDVKNAPSGTTFTFTIDDVVLTGWTYNPAANKETSDSITV